MNSSIQVSVDWDILLSRGRTYFENNGWLFAGFSSDKLVTKIAFLPELKTSVQDLILMGFEIIPVTI